MHRVHRPNCSPDQTSGGNGTRQEKPAEVRTPARELSSGHGTSRESRQCPHTFAGVDHSNWARRPPDRNGQTPIGSGGHQTEKARVCAPSMKHTSCLSGANVKADCALGTPQAETVLVHRAVGLLRNRSTIPTDKRIHQHSRLACRGVGPTNSTVVSRDPGPLGPGPLGCGSVLSVGPGSLFENGWVRMLS